MITTRSAGQPSRCASCARAYCRSRDSRFSSTCCGEDCRIYTIASRSRCRSQIFEVDPRPKVRADGVAPAGPPSRSMTRVSREFIAHLLIVARRAELSHHDAAEGDQRSLTLLVRQPIPELVERRRPHEGRGRGGATTAAARDMGHLLGSLGVELGSIPPAEGGRPARLWGCPPIPVKARGSGQSPSCFLYQMTSPSWSQKRILIRSRRRLTNRKRWPVKGSW